MGLLIAVISSVFIGTYIFKLDWRLVKRMPMVNKSPQQFKDILLAVIRGILTGVIYDRF